MERKNNTHIIVKLDDAENYLTVAEKVRLQNILRRIEDGRRADNKEFRNQYLIVNMDEPYAEGVLQLILLGEERKAFCENIKGEKCSTRDYGANQYKAPCYECCLGCAGAINMECNFVCTKVAEHYHPSEED